MNISRKSLQDSTSDRESSKYLNQIIHGHNIDVLKELPSHLINLAILDPPYYEVDRKQNYAERHGFQWKLPNYHILLLELKRILKGNGQFYIFGQQPMLAKLYDLISRYFKYTFEIVWCKPLSSVWTNDIMPLSQHEVIWNFRKAHIKTDEFTYNLKSPVGIERDVQHIDNVVASHKEYLGHPTQKPEALIRLLIEISTNPGDIVLDPFLGSGTTAISAEILHRNWLGIESDRNFYNTAVKRLNDFRGQHTITRWLA